MGLGCPVCNLLAGYPGGKSFCDREDCPELDTVAAMPRALVQDPNATVRAEIVAIGDKIMEAQIRQKARIGELESALKPFADMATAVEENMPAKDDRWALVRVRDKAITHADLKRAREAMNGGSK